MPSLTQPMPASHGGWPYEPVEPDALTADEIRRLPAACSLSSAALRQRKREIREQFVPRVIGREPIEDGYVYWFERNDENFRIVADFALFESRCCAFLSFGIGLHPGGTKISLRITGPAGREYLDGVAGAAVPETACC